MKTVRSFTLSPEVQKYIENKKTKGGISSSSAVEMLIRELIELKKETLPVVERAS